MMDLRRYPLDEQNCTLEIESCKYRSSRQPALTPTRIHRTQQLLRARAALRRACSSGSGKVEDRLIRLHIKC